jgi:hypothetical protein
VGRVAHPEARLSTQGAPSFRSFIAEWWETTGFNLRLPSALRVHRRVAQSESSGPGVR